MIAAYDGSPLEAGQAYPPGNYHQAYVVPRRTPPNPYNSSKTHRVGKPSSATSSPNNAGLARRRSVMNEPMSRRRMAMIEEQALAVSGMAGGRQGPVRSSRPLSWHPSSNHLAPQTYLHAVHPPPHEYPYTHYGFNGASPSSAIHSAYESPVSAMSPLSLPYTDYDSPYGPPSTASYFPHNTYPMPTTSHPPPMTSATSSSVLSTPYISDSILGTHYDWNKFVSSGFNRATDPPTPLNSITQHHAGPVLTPDDAISYESLTEADTGGVELVALGLYDKPKPACRDTPVDAYLMAPPLLGKLYGADESVGQGLKLEESWMPAREMDDEDEEER